MPISWPQHGNIVFENVSLKHENQTENVITNLNLNIPTGQRVSFSSYLQKKVTLFDSHILDGDFGKQNFKLKK